MQPLTATIFAIATGGAIGAVSRYTIALLVTPHSPFSNGFPLGTFIANCVGAFLMGICFVLFQESSLTPSAKAMITTGFLGALTTFSTFALEVVTLFQNGQATTALLYLVLSNLVGLGLLWVGMTLSGGA